MATTVRLGKKGKKHALQKAPAKLLALDFELQDNGDNTFTVLGIDKAGNTLDIADVATLSECVSDDPTIVTVDPPVGMTSAMHAVGPIGAAKITVTATWNDGSIGPFTFTLPVTTKSGPATGVVIDLGTPTVH